MPLSTTELNQRRRERYKAKKYMSDDDEEQKVNSNKDEIFDLNIIENKKVNSNDDEIEKVNSNDDEIDDYEDLYNIPKPKPIVKDEKPIVNNDKPLSRRELSKSKPISSAAHNVFNRIMNNQDSQPTLTNTLSHSTTKTKESNITNENSEVKDRLLLQHKIKQYRILFPNELKHYKVKDNATVKKLKEHLEEIEIMISLSSVDEFMMAGILQSIKMVEGFSARTENYNITGLADMLKANPEFNKLVKQLYLKYNTFEAVPPEAQLLFIVATSAWVCKSKNQQKAKINNLLDEEYIAEINE